MQLAPTLNLPVSTITQKLGFLGVTGSGKSYAATKLAELMMASGGQIVALDPVGVWRGLRMGGDFSIYIFGGASGDFPLEPTSGALLADVIVDKGISAVLDVSHFEYDADKTRFATAFADRFFFRKKTAKSAVHVFIEECQEFIPQNPQRGEEKMLHAFQRMWKLGRNFGIGGSLISQRPQDVNKKALNQAQTLFVFQLTGPQERKAVENWIADNGVSAADLNDLLPKIKVGQPHVWSPTFLKISETIKISRKITGDISATPEVGQAAKAQKLTPIFSDELRAAMAATVERAKAEDPAELRAEIARLRKQLVEKNKHPLIAVSEPKTVEVSVLSNKERETLERSLAYLKEIHDELEHTQTLVNSVLEKAAERQRIAKAQPRIVQPPTLSPVKVKGSGARESVRVGTSPARTGASGARRMMIALAQRPGLSKRQLGLRAQVSPKGGSFGTYLGSLRSQGFVTNDGDAFSLTTAGSAALGYYEPLPSGTALQSHYLNELGNSGAGRMLAALIAVFPDALSKEGLGLQSQIDPAGGSFGTYLGKLRTLELVTGKTDLRASEELFD